MRLGLMRIGSPQAGRGHPPRAGPAPAVPPRGRRGTSRGAQAPTAAFIWLFSFSGCVMMTFNYQIPEFLDPFVQVIAEPTQ